MKTSRILHPLFSYGMTGALLLQALGIVVVPGLAKAAEGSPLLINEINWGGSNVNPSDQWVEVYNSSETVYDFADSPVQLEMAVANKDTYPGCIDTESSTPENCVVAELSTGTVPAGAYVVIGRLSGAQTSVDTEAVDYRANTLKTTILKDTTYTLAGVGDGVSALETVPESAITGKGVSGDSIEKTAASIERVLVEGVPSADPAAPSSWRTSKVYGVSFTTPGLQLGTPGMINEMVAAPKVTKLSQSSDTDVPTISGTVASPATRVEITVRQKLDREHDYVVQNVVSAVDGTFSLTLSTLKPGRYTFSVQAFDENGNMSEMVSVQVGKQPSENGNQFVLLATDSPVVQPVVAPTPTYTNASTITFNGTVSSELPLPTNTEIDILNDGVFVGKAAVVNGTFSYSAVLTPNAQNEFKFVTVIPQFTDEAPNALPLVSNPVSRIVTNDSIVPSALDSTLVTVESNAPGTQDRLIGQAGAVKNAKDKLAPVWVNFYADAALTRQIGSPVKVNADGSFAAVSIGDNLYQEVYAYVYDEAGNSTKTEPLGVVRLLNPVSPQLPTSGIGLTVVSRTQTQVKIAWNPVEGAVNYYLRYRTENGEFTAPVLVCSVGTVSCVSEATLINLTPDTGYVVAIAVVDRYGNVSPYQELSLRTLMPVPTSVEEPVAATTTVATTDTTLTRRTTRVQPAPVAAEASPTPEATPTPGDVKSASTEEDTGRNWTPWIILGVLVGIAALASLGYFYWFGGEAGAAAMASLESSKKKEEDTKDDSESSNDSKGNSSARKKNDRRW